MTVTWIYSLCVFKKFGESFPPLLWRNNTLFQIYIFFSTFSSQDIHLLRINAVICWTEHNGSSNELKFYHIYSNISWEQEELTLHTIKGSSFNQRIMHGLFSHISKIAYSYFILNSCTSLQCNCAHRTYTEISPCSPAMFSLQRQNYPIQKKSLKSDKVCVDWSVMIELFSWRISGNEIPHQS